MYLDDEEGKLLYQIFCHQTKQFTSQLCDDFPYDISIEMIHLSFLCTGLK